MALTDCPECAAKVSSMAEACPQCGKPIRPGPAPRNHWLEGMTFIWLLGSLGSIGLFLWNELRPGTLRPVLAGQIGLLIRRDSTLEAIVPLTVISTAAPRVVRHITAIQAAIRTADGGGYRLRWWFNLRFVGRDHSERARQDSTDTHFRDMPVYAGRAFPFAVRGDSAAYRVLDLFTEDFRKPPASELGEFVKEFQLRLTIHTIDGQATPTEGRYRCYEVPSPRKTTICNSTPE
jgi:hypothetical protein